jgi:hypothetical protein
MELKEFVKETLLQLVLGVKEAQEKCSEFGGFVNPVQDLSCRKTDVTVVSTSDKNVYVVTDVGFKVGLTEHKGVGEKTGIGVFFSGISMGDEQKKDTSRQTVTCIDFSIPVLLPFVEV